MCLILDANKYSDFLDPNNSDMQPVRDWLANKNGKIVYSPTEVMKKELDRHHRMKTRIDEYRRSGKLRQINKEKVDEAQTLLHNLRSNDRHIIALAKAADVKLLISNDQALHQDFKDIVGGRIYQDRTHEHLLTRDTCP